jgi:hypothetical protein
MAMVSLVEPPLPTVHTGTSPMPPPPSSPRPYLSLDTHGWGLSVAEMLACTPRPSPPVPLGMMPHLLKAPLLSALSSPSIRVCTPSMDRPAVEVRRGCVRGLIWEADEAAAEREEPVAPDAAAAAAAIPPSPLPSPLSTGLYTPTEDTLPPMTLPYTRLPLPLRKGEIFVL